MNIIYPKSLRVKKTGFFDYEKFEKKFKPKKTTDDCYTPEPVYNAILDWLVEQGKVTEDTEIIRPFFPGANYMLYEYPKGSVVVDNPPFSILAEIVNYYQHMKIPFFLFAPTLTLLGGGGKQEGVNCVLASSKIIYENGASIPTSFVSNLFDVKLFSSLELKQRIEDSQKVDKKPPLPKYDYPNNVVTISRINKLLNRGIEVSITAKECGAIRTLDAQRGLGKSIFGNGLLVSDEKAEEIARLEVEAENLKIEQLKAKELRVQDETITFNLSPRERELVEVLNKRSRE